MDGLHLLLIDDEPAVTVILSHTAKRWGHTITVARTLAEGREALAAHPDVDLLLVDVGLPDGSGLDLLTEIRQQSLFASLPTIVLTGGGDDRLAAQAQMLDARLVTKPFSPTKLVSLITEMTTPPGETS